MARLTSTHSTSSRDHGSLQKVALRALRPVFASCWRIRTVGLENVPTSGPAILAPNHTSVIDSFFLPAVLPRRITFVGKAEYLDDWKTRRLFPALGMIPIDRSGGDASTRALDTAARLLDDGELFGIYPEGTRARDGYLHKGHTGAARLSMQTGAPIIPVGILGTRTIQPPDTRVPRPFRPVEVRFGKPIRPASAPDVGDTRMQLRQITDELMFEIRALTGQDYVNTYATKGTAGADETPGRPADPEMPPRRSSAEVLRAAV
ncbi:MAG: lysophospholipid acyltransferase family protein [Acidimicrobiales bacterium]